MNHVLDGGPNRPHVKGKFLVERTCWACPMTLCRELCKNGSTDRDAIWVVDSDRPKKVCLGVHTGPLTPPDEYN